MEERTLKRSKSDRVIGGVLGGIAEYLNLDSTLIRLIFILLCFFSIKGALLVYLLLYIVMPENTEENIPNKKKQEVVLGLFLIFLGMSLFLNEIYHFLTFKILWPMFIVLLGFYLLVKGFEEGKK